MATVVCACRSCGSPRLRAFLALGELPLADALLRASDLAQPEARFPLDVARCEQCGLVQILTTVAPDELYCRDYPYYSSFSDALLAHARRNALHLIASRRLTARSLVIEIASNDGYLLKNFAQAGIPVLGIDPAAGPASAAERAGIPTRRRFFGAELAAELRSEQHAADVIIANNVLAHVPDLNGFVAGLQLLLAPEGVAVIEVPYVRDLIEQCEFDTIYHEHLCYFAVAPLLELFRRHGLTLQHVEHHSIHGGSLRLLVGHGRTVSAMVEQHLEAETALGMHTHAYYQRFAERVRDLASALGKLLRDRKQQGKRIAAYGAAAKGATLLNHVGLGADLIDYVADRNVHKQGRYMPGVHLPIVDPARLLQDRPDYVLLLAWNFRDEIMQQQAAFVRAGGRFIVPVPEPAIV